MLNNVKCYKAMCEGMLDAMGNGRFHGRETERGTRWAIEFVESLEHETMTERELDHAVRLTHFRGSRKPEFAG